MSAYKQLTEDQWVAIFQPIGNHFNPFAPFDWVPGRGTLFETYGEELAFVRQQSTSRIWTLCSSEFGNYILSGFHTANRLGYFVATGDTPEGVDLEIALENRSMFCWLVFHHAALECSMELVGQLINSIQTSSLCGAEDAWAVGTQTVSLADYMPETF